MDYVKIGNRIRSKRMELGLSQEKLSEFSNISPSFMSGIELGNKSGAFDTYLRIAKVLNVSLDYLTQDVIPAARENVDHQELIKTFDKLSYKQQRYVLEALKNFCEFVNN